MSTVSIPGGRVTAPLKVPIPSLEVGETLSHARQALQIHRKQMKRRVGPAPIDHTPEDGQTISVGNVWSNISSGESRRKTARERLAAIGRGSKVTPISNEVGPLGGGSDPGVAPLEGESDLGAAPLGSGSDPGVAPLGDSSMPCPQHTSTPQHQELQATATPHGMTKEELSEYQDFMKQLSSSRGNIVTVTAAPKDKRTSYHKHGTGKLGTTNISLTREQQQEQPLDIGEESSEAKQTAGGDKMPTSATGSIVISVLPKDTTVASHDDDPPCNDHHFAQSSSDIGSPSNQSIGSPSNQSIGSSIGPSNQSIGPSIGPSNKSIGPSIGPLSPASPLAQDSSRSINGDLVLEEWTDTIESDAYVAKPDAHTAKPDAYVLKLDDVPDSPVIMDDVPDTPVMLDDVPDTPVMLDDVPDTPVVQDDVTPANAPVILDDVPDTPVTLADTPQSDKESLMLSKADVSIPPLSKAPIPPLPSSDTIVDNLPMNGRIKLPPLSIVEDEDKIEGENDCMPLLRVKSTTSLYVPEMTYKCKRERQPPSYSIHCNVPKPPCPPYNVTQPTDNEVLNTTIQAYKSIANKSDFNIDGRNPATNRQDRATNGWDPTTNGRNPASNGRGPAVDGWDTSTDGRDLVALPINSSRQLSVNDNHQSYSAITITPVHEAARNGNVGYLNALLKEQKYNVNGLDSSGYTPLMYCILDDNTVQIPSANALVVSGANLDHKAADGSTVLHHASYIGALPLVELLLLSGANPDVGDNDGRLPLHWATNAKSQKIIQLLLKHSSNDINVVDNSDMTPLMWACYNCSHTAAKCLIEKGAEREEKDIDGKTAMHWAAQNCAIDCLKLLLSKDMTYFKDHEGCTVLHRAANSGCVLGVQHILSLRPDAVHDIDKMGHTPLHYAAASDKVDICYILLNRGADATQRDCEGHTPVDYGHANHHEYTVALFTCHNTSMADFTRVMRSTSHATLYSRAKSFSSLGALDDEANFMNESMSDITSLQQHNTKTLKSLSVKDLTSKNIDTSKYEEFTSKGCHLGKFTDNPSEPPLHYFFWIDHAHKVLYWSRSMNKHGRQHSTVRSVHEGPSNVVTSRYDYSPLDLHKFVFYVEMKEGEVVSLLAYGEDTYVLWIRALQAISSCCSDESGSSHPQPQYTSTPLPAGTNATKTKKSTIVPLLPNQVI